MCNVNNRMLALRENKGQSIEVEERRFGCITHSKKAQFKFHFSTSGLKRKTRNRIAAMGNTIHYLQFPLLSLEKQQCPEDGILFRTKNHVYLKELLRKTTGNNL